VASHERTWKSDPDAKRRRIAALELLNDSFQRALGHELPNQFVAVGGLARLVEAELGDRLEGKSAEYLDRLATLVRKSDILVRALADIGRMCRSPGPVAAVSLKQVVQEAATEVKVLFARRAVEYHFQDEMPLVQVPQLPLKRALVHLFRNALEASVGEGPAVVRVTADANPEGIALHVTDEGRGLSEAEMGQLFQPFSAGAASAGQGLGLFFVCQAAALWGGGVCVRSEPGRGSTFTLLFPANVG
jgi:signal transduction histidine kinase